VDDGAHWQNVTPKALAPWSKVGVLEASHFDAATAYAAVDRHRIDDVDPYVYRTRDGGRSWTPIRKGIPAGSYVNVVREDAIRRGLLYAGTETGVFVSFDDGENWQPLQLNLPNCSIRDIEVKHGDLVVATHGRSFWVLDDVSPLRQLDAKTAAEDVFLFAPREAVRLHPAGFQGTPEPKDEPMGENPKNGAVLDYVLKAAAQDRLVLEILDAKGEVVRRFASDDAVRRPEVTRIVTTPDWVAVSEPPSAAAGMHRFVWDLHDALPEELRTPGSTRGASGPWAPPGRYTVRLTALGRTLDRPLVVVKDPRLPSSVTDDDLVLQHGLVREIQAERLRVAAAQKQAKDLRTQISVRRRETPAVAFALDAFAKELDRAAGPPIRTEGEEFFDSEEIAPTTLRRLATSLAGLQAAVESADVAPTPDARAGFSERRRMVEEGLARWKDTLTTGKPKVDEILRRAGLAPLKAD